MTSRIPTVDPPALITPLQIGPLTLDVPVVLAPMAGITNTAFRRLCREYGAGLFVSEMITSRALSGAAGPPGLDELLATEIGDAGAFEDPLGIAMSWEEKYTKKKSAAATEAAASTDAGSTKGDEPAEGT